MTVFAEKTKGPQNAAPTKAEIAARGVRQSPEVSSVLYPSSFAGRPEPGVAHLDARGGELQEERSAALQTGRNPDDPVSRPRDAVRKALREAAANPPTRPGSWSQQELTIPEVHPGHLWFLPRIQERMRAIAEMEVRERVYVGPQSKVNHTVESRMEYWGPKFQDSVKYILYVRQDGGMREKRLMNLHAQEAALVKSAPADLVERVEALRRTHQQKWQEQVDLAADRFVILASNQFQFAAVRQKADPVGVYGLPESLEGTVKWTDHADTLAQGSSPVAPTVVKFMEEVQKQTGTKVLAGNYPGHENYSPKAGPETVGKYSIDVYPWIKANAEGFYEHKPVVKFFLAVDRAATATNVSWMAFYNDFAVAKEVNETLGKKRIQFFPGTGDGPDGKGSIHHGPDPYLLHIHFNIMPNELAEKYFAAKKKAEEDAKKAAEKAKKDAEKAKKDTKP